jgi:hypothetical protein
MGWFDAIRRTYTEIRYLSELMVEQQQQRPWTREGVLRWRRKATNGGCTAPLFRMPIKSSVPREGSSQWTRSPTAYEPPG